jgi:membrane protein DedA with SNARE-associated domain
LYAQFIPFARPISQIVAGIFLLAMRAILFLALSCLDWLSSRSSQSCLTSLNIGLPKDPSFRSSHNRRQAAALGEIVNGAFTDFELARYE